MYSYDTYERALYRRSLVLSLFLHGILFAVMLAGLRFPAEFKSGIVYSVSIEGGKSLGGIAQVQTKENTQLAPPKNVSTSEETEKSKTEQKTEDPKVAPPDAEVSLAEKQKLEEKKKEEEKKREEERKKKEEEERKKKEVAKPTAAPAKQPTAKPAPKKEKAAASPGDVNKDYMRALQRYMGESSEAGGKGFGAAKIGGNGMGGGVVKPPEFFMYRQTIRNRVKSGWNWFNPNTDLVTWVTFRISQDGAISDVQMSQSSGNREYDESVMRAIYKASPLPPPPQIVFEDFKFVKMSFNPKD